MLKKKKTKNKKPTNQLDYVTEFVVDYVGFVCGHGEYQTR